MASSKAFSGPPSNKATASTLAAAVATLFWTIAAHTFWKTLSTADMSLYIATSTVILTAITGFLVPESAAFSEHNSQRLAKLAATQQGPAASVALGTLEARLQGIQAIQDAIAQRMGIEQAPAIPAPNQ